MSADISTQKPINVALMGNPNVGKSTVFNVLTGMRQHTGNWPGKTVAVATGEYTHRDRVFSITDLPGTYSLFCASPEEEVALDFLCFGQSDITLIVADATALTRGINLCLQILEITGNAILCVNLIDEARRRDIFVDTEVISAELGIPVVPVCAASGEGLDALLDAVFFACTAPAPPQEKPAMRYGAVAESNVSRVCSALPACLPPLTKRFCALRLLCGEEALALALLERYEAGFNRELLREALDYSASVLELSGVPEDGFCDLLIKKRAEAAKALYERSVRQDSGAPHGIGLKIDRLLTSRRFGIPIMLALLCLIFWITITGANYPSALLSKWLFSLGDIMGGALLSLGAPEWLYGILIMGVWRTASWVVAVMLPPMAIFFPLFTLLEDLGYLPRVAFNMDSAFERCGACGRQSLTMCMGFGCNAVGVMGCRIISSPRERLIAILTNVFVPCNGRFPPPR